ncbi:unnamed protein product [Ectocarpus sp. 12 AP-2014]
MFFVVVIAQCPEAEYNGYKRGIGYKTCPPGAMAETSCFQAEKGWGVYDRMGGVDVHDGCYSWFCMSAFGCLCRLANERADYRGRRHIDGGVLHYCVGIRLIRSTSQERKLTRRT